MENLMMKYYVTAQCFIKTHLWTTETMRKLLKIFFRLLQQSIFSYPCRYLFLCISLTSCQISRVLHHHTSSLFIRWPLLTLQVQPKQSHNEAKRTDRHGYSSWSLHSSFTQQVPVTFHSANNALFNFSTSIWQKVLIGTPVAVTTLIATFFPLWKCCIEVSNHSQSWYSREGCSLIFAKRA